MSLVYLIVELSKNGIDFKLIFMNLLNILRYFLILNYLNLFTLLLIFSYKKGLVSHLIEVLLKLLFKVLDHLISWKHSGVSNLIGIIE